MSTAEWPRPTETLPGPRAKASRPRRSARKAAPGAPPLAPAGLADFAALEVQAIDGEKWPVSPVVWWQPELPVELPKSSGLRNERRHKTPIAGFVKVEIAPVCPAGPTATPERVLAPQLPKTAPCSDLAPLGWDARSMVRKGSAA
ncbi:MAG TPA: hypothetical protein VKT49_18920 [Bryobacteraceae bacterium]|nr:hypothetical protein [Bryobacteraceae bacterium]